MSHTALIILIMEPIRDFFRLEDEEPHLVPTILTICVIMGLLASFFAESNPYVFFEICRYVSLLSLWAIILIGLVFLSLRRWVDSRRTKLGPGEIARQDGYAFGLWFTAHNLVWVFLISVLMNLYSSRFFLFYLRFCSTFGRPLPV